MIVPDTNIASNIQKGGRRSKGGIPDRDIGAIEKNALLEKNSLYIIGALLCVCVAAAVVSNKNVFDVGYPKSESDTKAPDTLIVFIERSP